MKFSVSAILAFAAAALARPRFTNSNFFIEEGQPFTLTWEGAAGTVDIKLKTGDPENLETVAVLAGEITGNSFTWTPTDLPSGTYAFEITDETGESNYSKQWVYEGTDLSSSAVPSTEDSTATSTFSSVLSTITSESTTEISTETETESETTTETETETETETTTTSSEEAPSTTLFTTTTEQTPSTTSDPQPTTSIANLTGEDAAQRFTSPLGLVLVTVAALLLFN
ncbi:hypothetical protein VTH06DRAFT_7991 [Thermothelomyces fergusii]